MTLSQLCCIQLTSCDAYDGLSYVAYDVHCMSQMSLGFSKSSYMEIHLSM